MFSWSDVYTLLKLYTNAQPTEKRGVTFMLACSPTSASSGEVYAITISDPSAFLVKMNVDLANIRANTPTLNFGTPQSELIEALDDKLGDKYASNNDSEQVFLDYFNDFGISTYKANPVIDNWSKLTIDDSSVLTAGTVIEIPCN